MFNFTSLISQAFSIVKLISNLLVSFSYDQGLIAAFIVSTLTIYASAIIFTSITQSR